MQDQEVTALLIILYTGATDTTRVNNARRWLCQTVADNGIDLPCDVKVMIENRDKKNYERIKTNVSR